MGPGGAGLGLGQAQCGLQAWYWWWCGASGGKRVSESTEYGAIRAELEADRGGALYTLLYHAALALSPQSTGWVGVGDPVG